jgi:hypothetical protein
LTLLNYSTQIEFRSASGHQSGRKPLRQFRLRFGAEVEPARANRGIGPSGPSRPPRQPRCRLRQPSRLCIPPSASTGIKNPPRAPPGGDLGHPQRRRDPLRGSSRARCRERPGILLCGPVCLLRGLADLPLRALEGSLIAHNDFNVSRYGRAARYDRGFAGMIATHTT